jgi:hypothetical protein
MKRPGYSGRVDELLYFGSEPVAGILVHFIAMSAGQQHPVAQEQSADEGSQPAQAADCYLPGNNGRKGGPGIAGGKCSIGDSQNRHPTRM